MAVVFSTALLMAPATAMAGQANGKTGKAVKSCNVGLTLGGSFTCIVPK
jgi:hypothetical protein